RYLVEAWQYPIRPIQPRAQQRRGFRPLILAANQRSGITEQIVGVGRAAFGEISPEAVYPLGLQRGELQQLRIGFVVARQQRQRDAAEAASFDQALDPIGPIGAAAEQPGTNQPSTRDSLPGGVYGEVVSE